MSDFAYHSKMFRMPSEIIAGLPGADLNALNIPSEPEHVAAYCARTQRESIPDYEVYILFNFFAWPPSITALRGGRCEETPLDRGDAKKGKHLPSLVGYCASRLRELLIEMLFNGVQVKTLSIVVHSGARICGLLVSSVVGRQPCVVDRDG